jgi:outer membrane protein assembly factor BamB
MGTAVDFSFNLSRFIDPCFFIVGGIMNRYFCLLLIVLVSSLLFAQQNKLSWKAELLDDVKKIQPIQNGKYIFLWADKYAWVYENATGKKMWSVKIKEYSEKAVHQLINDSLYLVANEDTLECYNVLANTMVWKKSYQKIEQDRFLGLNVIDSTLLFHFKEIDVAVNLESGKELWRAPLAYERSLIENGTVNFISLPKIGKYLAFLDNDDCALISLVNGKKLLSVPKAEPNSDLIKQKRIWYYVEPEEHFAALMFKKNFIVINLDSNKIVTQRIVNVSDQFNVLLSTAIGCAVIGEEKLIHVNFLNNIVAETPIEVDELRNIIITQTDSGTVAIISQKNKLSALNLGSGKLLWQTAPKYIAVNGFVHRIVARRSNNIIVTYLDPTDDLKLYLMSINLLTGEINYRTNIAHADESLPKRILPLTVNNDARSISFGFENIGFDYNVSIDSLNGNAKILIHTTSEMIEPNSDKKGGEGLVVVHLEDGKILSKNYMKIAEGMSFKGGLSALAKPITIGNNLLLPGNKNLVAMNSEAGKIQWMLVEQDLGGSYVFDMALIDSILYVKTGGFKQEFSYDPKKEKLGTKKMWEEDDYLLLAVDTSNGKIYWKKEFKSDPGRIFHDYSLAHYSKDGKHLFFGSEKFLYSLALFPAKKDSITWSFEFSDSGIGKMNYGDLYLQSTYWNGERAMTEDISGFRNDSLITLSSSMNIGESFTHSVSKIIHCTYDNRSDKLLVFGEDGIASVNPTTGKRLWYYEWDFSAKAVHHRPMILKDNIFYFIDGKITLINIDSGKIVWQTKLDKKNVIFIMPDRSSIIAIENDVVTGFIIP